MKIAFITPSPITLKHDWYRDLLYQKVGVPNLAGYLKRAGFADITHYDFNNQIKQRYAENPGQVRLMLYSDKRAVNCFLHPGPAFLYEGAAAIREQTFFLLDALKVEHKDLYGISLNAFLGDTLEIELGIRLAKCLAKALKERFPASVVALGGLQNMSILFQKAEYRAILRDCAEIDYAVCGDAHKVMLQICRAVERGVPFKARASDNFTCQRINGKVLILAGKPEDLEAINIHYFEQLPAPEVKDPSIPDGFPAYEKANSAAHSYTGRQIRSFYHLPDSLSNYLKRSTPDNYLTLQVSFSEGCRFNCFFCANAKTSFFSLDIDESIRILKTLKSELGCRHFLFYNPNFNPTYDYARTFLKKLIKADLDIRWADCFNLRHMDRDLIALMREAGVIKVVTGVEYPTARMLKYINKGVTVDQINRNLEELHKAGIWNHILLITGMPTETLDDVRELKDWLRNTKDLVNAYTVGSFHMAEGSPFHANPEKFGFRLKDAIKLYCQSGFDEKDGLKWKEKILQNQRSNEHIRQYIDDLKRSRKPTGTRMDDSHLLMYLYRALGHDRKKLIEELYEAAYTVNPHIAAAREHLLEQAGNKYSELSSLLRGSGMDIEFAPLKHDFLAFTLEKAGMRVACSMRARSEDVLINPADNRFHGDYFVLQAEEAAPRSGELAELTGELGGKLTVEKLHGGHTGKLALLLETRAGTARFIISLNSRTPSFTQETLRGSFPPGLLPRVGRLLLASAAAAKRTPRAAAKEFSAIKKNIPAILKLAEAWPRSQKPLHLRGGGPF